MNQTPESLGPSCRSSSNYVLTNPSNYIDSILAKSLVESGWKPLVEAEKRSL